MLLLTSREFFRVVGLNHNITFEEIRPVNREALINWFLFVFLQCCDQLLGKIRPRLDLPNYKWLVEWMTTMIIMANILQSE